MGERVLERVNLDTDENKQGQRWTGTGEGTVENMRIQGRVWRI